MRHTQISSSDCHLSLKSNIEGELFPLMNYFFILNMIYMAFLLVNSNAFIPNKLNGKMLIMFTNNHLFQRELYVTTVRYFVERGIIFNRNCKVRS